MKDKQAVDYPLENVKKQTVLCEDWNDFRDKIAYSTHPIGAGRYMGERIFRGQAKSPPDFSLASAWQRRFPSAVAVIEKSLGMPVNAVAGGGLGLTFIQSDPPDALDKYLQRFKERLDAVPGFSIRNWEDEEVLALGRHYGLITTLLDWTYSPYVAAFFAMEECYRLFHQGAATLPKNSVVVWCLLLTDELNASINSSESHLKLVKSRGEGAQRQIAQQGIFTDLRVGPNLESYLFERGLLNHLTCYEIPSSAHGPAIRDLYLMNIHFATMYPDVVGAALQANINSGIYDQTGQVLSKMIPDEVIGGDQGN
jgi:hypothetical protein